MNKNIIFTVLGVLLLSAIVVVYLKISEQSERVIEVEHEFIFKALDGRVYNINASEKKFKIQGMENKIVFLKIFGWECDFCMKEVPELIKLKNALSDKFAVIAIEAQEHSKEECLREIKKYGINYPVVMGENQKEFYMYLQKQYGWTGVIPLTIVLSSTGDVLAFELGAKSYSLSELFQASLLKK